MSVDFFEEEFEPTARPAGLRKESFSEQVQKKFKIDKRGLRAIAIGAILIFLCSSAVFAAVGLSKQKELQNARQDFINRFSPAQNAQAPK